MGRLIIRTDANTEIGSGHLMRCLALAQAWKDSDGEVIFITACNNNGLLQRLQEEDFSLHLLSHSHPNQSDWDLTAKVLAKYPDSWIVLDGYHFDESYQQNVKESGHRLLVIDDMAHLKHYYADILLNQNLHAEQLYYSREPYSLLLLGTEYVLLRREFLDWKGWKHEAKEVARHILITLGSSDPANNTLKVIESLPNIDIDGLEALVVVGPGNPHSDLIQSMASCSCIPLRLIHDARNMPELMAWADVAISTAGSVIWELCFMGVPAIIGISSQVEEVTENSLGKKGGFVNIGWFDRISVDDLVSNIRRLLCDAKLRHEMSTYGQHLVNGNGCNRILGHL